MRSRLGSFLTAVLVLLVLVTLSLAFNSPHNASSSQGVRKPVLLARSHTSGQAKTLTFADRVAYQRAIEQVYWHHRIWPKERPDPKPSLDAVMSQAQLENKVTDYLRDSKAMEDYWQQPNTGEQLQAEMDRIAQDTKQSEVLRELF